MPLFLEASALVKLYVQEPGSKSIEAIIDQAHAFGELYISELSVAEVVSAIVKKVRIGELRERYANLQCRTFAEDCRHTFFVTEIDSALLTDAANLLSRHGFASKFGAGDAIQLACANKVRREMSPPLYTLVASDAGFNAAARAAGHQVWDPENDDIARLLTRHAGIWP